MILDVIKESEHTSNNTKNKINSNANEKNIDKVQLKRIKELLDESQLRYVSANVRELLDIKKQDDPECFMKNKEKTARRAVQVGEKFRVILYIRLSQEDGDLEDGDVSRSIKNQLLYLLDECNKRENWSVVGIFCEEDISGVDDNRPEWLKSIRFAEIGNTEIVLCKSQSRFTRSLEMVEKYLHKCFPEWNVRFLGLVDNSDTSVEANKKSRQINGLVNEWFVEDTSKSTRATLNSMKRNGQFTGSFAPYGYFIDPKDKHHLIPDPHAREAIRLMAGMLKHGKSLSKVSEVLMRKGFLTPADYKTSLGIHIHRGKNRIKSIRYMVDKNETLKSIAYKFYVTTEEIKIANNMTTNTIKEGDILIIPHKQKWTGSMIRTIMTDETQIGTLVQGKTERMSFKNHKAIPKSKDEWIRVPHCHEANLDLETFNIVSSMFESRTKNQPQKNGEIPLFSKKVYCSCCGKAFHKNRAKVKSGMKEYLQCRGNSTCEGHICDNTDSIDLEELKEYVLENIKNKIGEYYELSKVSKEYYLQNTFSNIDNDIDRLEKEKQKIEDELEKKNNVLVQLYNDKATGVISPTEFGIIKNSNTVEIEKMNAKISEINSEISTLRIDKDKQIDKLKLFEKYRDISELNKVVLDAFVTRIEIGKIDSQTAERPIKIEWNLHTC